MCYVIELMEQENPFYRSEFILKILVINIAGTIHIFALICCEVFIYKL